jgi:uncharacterized protein (DUF433 family)
LISLGRQPQVWSSTLPSPRAPNGGDIAVRTSHAAPFRGLNVEGGGLEVLGLAPQAVQRPPPSEARKPARRSLDTRDGWRYPDHMSFEDYITITPGVRSGKPCIRGTRITVYDILEYLAGGMAEAQLLEDFPELRPEHIRATLAFAAARERRLAVSNAA